MPALEVLLSYLRPIQRITGPRVPLWQLMLRVCRTLYVEL
jgi:hypothetical protein